jgi:RHS repeat-associated protein
VIKLRGTGNSDFQYWLRYRAEPTYRCAQNLQTLPPTLSSGATETLTLGINDTAALNGSVSALIGGTATATDILTVTVFDAGLPGNSKAVQYTVPGGATLDSITSGLATAINNDTDLQGIGVSAGASGTKLTVISVSTNATSYLPSTKNSGGIALGTETFLWGLPANGTTTASITGSVSSGDQFTLTVFDASLAGGSVAKTVTGVSTPNAVATDLVSAVNGDTNLAALGVTAAAAIPTTSVSVVNISSTSNNATTYTFTKTGSSTIALSKNVGVSQATYNNVNELTSISAGGATRFKGTTDRPVLPTMTVDGGAVTMNSSSNFTANPILSSGSESIAVSATAGGGSGSTTNNYKFEVTGAGSQALTHDNNGNMTSDGTNVYAWDAENRLVKITYPGTNNFTDMTYDGLGRRVKIVETTSGSVTSTKQFVWCSLVPCEERDGSGTVIKQFFDEGQRHSTTDYHYVFDSPGSVREMVNDSGSIVAEYGYDPFGRETAVLETTASDFGFIGMYRHTRSGLNLTWFRPYNNSLGRWISRDPLEEEVGPNLYAYAANNPIMNIDPFGLAWGPKEWRDNALQHCIASCQLTKILGKDIAKAIGDWWWEAGGTNTALSSAVDQENNRIGRNAPCRENCGDYCRRQYRNGFLEGPYGPLTPIR